MQESHEAGSVRSVREGMRDALPVAGVYAASGVALGVLARQAALGPGTVGLMSLLVYAGSTQFVVVGLLIAATPFPVVLSTVLLLSLRSLTYGTALAPYVGGAPSWARLLLAFGLTDEAFALAIRRFRARAADLRYMAGVIGTTYPAWVCSTAIAAGLGVAWVRPEAFGLDVAFPAIFLGLVVPMLRTRREWQTAVLAVALVLMGRQVLPEGLAVLTAALLAPLASVVKSTPGEDPPTAAGQGAPERSG